MTEARLFDLNIEKILEAWESAHAVRELVPNAISAQQLPDKPGKRYGDSSAET